MLVGTISLCNANVVVCYLSEKINMKLNFWKGKSRFPNVMLILQTKYTVFFFVSTDILTKT